MSRGAGITATIVSALLIAAHFMRAGLFPLVVLGLAFPLLLLVGSPWATRAVQLLLALAAAEWIHTLIEIAAVRRSEGQPWTRMAIILGAIALFNLAAAVAVRERRKTAAETKQD